MVEIKKKNYVWRDLQADEVRGKREEYYCSFAKDLRIGKTEFLKKTNLKWDWWNKWS